MEVLALMKRRGSCGSGLKVSLSYLVNSLPFETNPEFSKNSYYTGQHKIITKTMCIINYKGSILTISSSYTHMLM